MLMSRYKLSPCNELPDKFLLCYHKVLDPQLFSISSKGQKMQWSNVVGDEVPQISSRVVRIAS